ncbi:hypothetical protein MHO82_01945 [Vibrio sp. Of7-15]|uniref:hypothetical protein n=1 Tax=Vibrio sp. Of7-15 TaxID=2724879 RepID=UPI001EF2D8D6|nr:hypothetical protein [Vibrio sp. Of7-15]MCG7495621.1 hypothetical protein [Vibrio sp. Of7-15]
MKRVLLPYFAMAAVSFSLFVQAEGEEGSVPNSDGNYKGDTVSFVYDVVLVDQEKSEESPEYYCLPSNEKIRIVSHEDEYFELYRVSHFGWVSEANKAEEEDYKNNIEVDKSSDSSIMRKNCVSFPDDSVELRYLPRSTRIKATHGMGGFELGNSKVRGFSYGALIAPYKYYKTRKEYIGSSTLAPFVGYRIDWNHLGIEFNPVLFAGATTIQDIDSEGDSSSLFGFSWGGGILFELKDEFNAGIIIGEDKVGRKENFKNNGKHWIAFSLGFDFSN